MEKTKRVRKLCGKCGKTAPVRASIRRCRLPAGLLGTYRCNGPLTVVARAAKPTARLRPQDVAQRKLDVVERTLAKKRSAMIRLVRSIATLERRVSKLQRQVNQTDDEIAARRARREQRATERASRRSRRGIALDGVAGASS